MMPGLDLSALAHGMCTPDGRLNNQRPARLRLQMQDSMLLDGKLQEYQRAFQAVDTSGNGTLGAAHASLLCCDPRGAK
jgi:hypothetical protein